MPQLRRIGYRDPETGKHYVFLTNHFTLSAKTIADVYKDRWQVELFFKALKQNLKIHAFVGNSRNAVLTQLWVALCAYLMLSYLKFLSKSGWSRAENLACIATESVYEARFTAPDQAITAADTQRSTSDEAMGMKIVGQQWGRRD